MKGKPYIDVVAKLSFSGWVLLFSKALMIIVGTDFRSAIKEALMALRFDVNYDAKRARRVCRGRQR